MPIGANGWIGIRHEPGSLEVAEAYSIPVASTLRAKGIFPAHDLLLEIIAIAELGFTP